MPLLRVTLHTATLHPQFLGTTITWWRDTAEIVQVMIAHEVSDAIPYEKNPVRRVCYGRETLRRRLSIAADRHNQYWITHNLLCAYLGANTGPKVLTGQVRRGAGMALTAVLWSSDLRGFTERSDRLPSERMIALLNALFEAQDAEIRAHGGEILKFIGDGLLAIFPIAETDAVATVATIAVAAVSQSDHRCRPPLRSAGDGVEHCRHTARAQAARSLPLPHHRAGGAPP